MRGQSFAAEQGEEVPSGDYEARLLVSNLLCPAEPSLLGVAASGQDEKVPSEVYEARLLAPSAPYRKLSKLIWQCVLAITWYLTVFDDKTKTCHANGMAAKHAFFGWDRALDHWEAMFVAFLFQ